MRVFVFTDKALESEAGRFVWLEMNTDRPQNAAFKSQYKIAALPTYFIVDPDSEKVLLRRVGGATAPQLLSILEAGRNAYASGTAPAMLSPADRLLARGDAQYGAGDYAAAAGTYQEALTAAPGDWAAYERTVEALLYALQGMNEDEVAATTARDAYPKLRRSGSAANVAATGLDCALALPRENPARAELVAALTKDAREVGLRVADRGLPGRGRLDGGPRRGPALGGLPRDRSRARHRPRGSRSIRSPSHDRLLRVGATRAGSSDARGLGAGSPGRLQSTGAARRGVRTLGAVG
jgi:tetratricopeptide (TPR) repeat protein